MNAQRQSARPAIAAGLIMIAVVSGLLGWWSWHDENQQPGRTNDVNSLTIELEQSEGLPVTATVTTAHHGRSVVILVIGGVALLFGVVFMAAMTPEEFRQVGSQFLEDQVTS